jgi:cytochrome d ubiquinol oxidase subunit I
MQILIGDWAGRDVAKAQPLKLAAMEGLAHTTRGAPVHLLGWYDNGRVVGGIEIPKLLSLISAHSPNAVVQGLDTAPPDRRPPVNIVRIAFQMMVGIGFLLGALGIWFVAVRVRHKRLPESRWFYRSVIVAGPLALIAVIAGWTTTEVGRQPWVVYKLMLTKDAVTRAPIVPVGYVTLAFVYLGLAVAVAWILQRLARAPLPES